MTGAAGNSHTLELYEIRIRLQWLAHALPLRKPMRRTCSAHGPHGRDWPSPSTDRVGRLNTCKRLHFSSVRPRPDPCAPCENASTGKNDGDSCEELASSSQTAS